MAELQFLEVVVEMVFLFSACSIKIFVHEEILLEVNLTEDVGNPVKKRLSKKLVKLRELVRLLDQELL